MSLLADRRQTLLTGWLHFISHFETDWLKERKGSLSRNFEPEKMKFRDQKILNCLLLDRRDGTLLNHQHNYIYYRIILNQC